MSLIINQETLQKAINKYYEIEKTPFDEQKINKLKEHLTTNPTNNLIEIIRSEDRNAHQIGIITQIYNETNPTKQIIKYQGLILNEQEQSFIQHQIRYYQQTRIITGTPEYHLLKEKNILFHVTQLNSLLKEPTIILTPSIDELVKELTSQKYL